MTTKTKTKKASAPETRINEKELARLHSVEWVKDQKVLREIAAREKRTIPAEKPKYVNADEHQSSWALRHPAKDAQDETRADHTFDVKNDTNMIASTPESEVPAEKPTREKPWIKMEKIADKYLPDEAEARKRDASISKLPDAKAREWDESIMSRSIKAIMDQEIINRQNKGKEFYRHDYDLALHIWTAIKGAGLKIVKERSK